MTSGESYEQLIKFGGSMKRASLDCQSDSSFSRRFLLHI